MTHPLRAHLPDYADEVLMQFAPIIQQALLAETEELDLAHAQLLGGLLLLCPADVRDLGAGNAGSKPPPLPSVSTQ